MTTWSHGRSGHSPDDPTSDRCTHGWCTVKVTHRFRDRGIPLCPEHAIDVWARVNDMMTVEQYTPPPPAPPRPDPPYEGFVYYIRIGDRVKIGHTMNPEQRLATYPPTMEFLCARRGDRTLERAEHQRFRAHLADGREWFWATPEVLAMVDDVRRQIPDEDSDLFDDHSPFTRRRHARQRVV